MRMMRNKKGNYLDIIDYLILSLFMGLILISGVVLWTETSDKLLNTTTITDNSDSTRIVTDFKEDYPGWFDWVILFLYVGFLGFSVWAARFIPSSHKLLFIGIFLTIFIVFVSFVFENGWDAFFTALFAKYPYISSLTLTKVVLDNLRIFALVYAFTVGVALYAKDE